MCLVNPEQIHELIEISFPKVLVKFTFSKCIIPKPYDLSSLSLEPIHPPIVFESFDFPCKHDPCFLEPNVDWVNMQSFYNQIEWSKRLYNESKAHLQPKVKMKLFYGCDSLLYTPLTSIKIALAIETDLVGGILVLFENNKSS